MSRNKVPNVAVIVETSNGWGRAIVKGIGKYIHKHQPWHTWIDAWGLGAPSPLPGKWRGDGIIADVCSSAMARHLEATGASVVNVSVFNFKNVKFPKITTNLHIAARLVVEHFLNRGFQHFAYYGLQRRSYNEEYLQEYATILEKEGHDCFVFKPGIGKGTSVDWHAHHQELIQWLVSLPKPVGVLAWPSRRGRQLIHACREARLMIPEQVAIIVGDEDELLCKICTPPLSSVALNSEQLGYDAAALLEGILQGQQPPEKPLFIDPIGIVTRQSTDTLAIDDTDLAHAVSFIRDHAADPIQVKDILRAVPVSRRWLEHRFQEVLGRTPAAEIRRVHLERAKELLIQTDMSVQKIADASGFGSEQYLIYTFSRQIGLSPHKFRSQIHGR